MTQSAQHADPNIFLSLEMCRSHQISTGTDSRVIFQVQDDDFAAGWSDETAFNDANTLFEADDFAAAETALNHFLERRPESKFADETRFLLGMSLFRQEKLHSALIVFSEIVRDFPNSDFKSLADFYSHRCKSLL